jgi:hypothetical protein
MKKFKKARVSRGGWGVLNWNCHNSSYNMETFIPEKDWATLLTLVGRIQDKKITYSKGMNILIDKNSEVPRPKLKDFIADNNLKKVTLLSKADVVAVRRETINELKSIKIEDFKFISDSDIGRLKLTGGEKYSLIVGNESNMDQEYFDVKNRCSIERGVSLSGYRNKKQNESIEFVFSLLNSKATLIYDDALMNEVNSGGLDLDDDIFETIEGMILSNDGSTFNLGIEMLSNVNLENNLFKIAVLMNYGYTTTNRFNALSYFKSNNFKALLAYLDSNKIRWNTKWEIFGMSMFVKFKNTEYEKNITEYLVKQMNNHFKEVYKDDIVEIVNIVFK